MEVKKMAQCTVVMECLEYDLPDTIGVIRVFFSISLMRQGYSTSILDIGVRRSEVVYIMRYVGAPLKLNTAESWGTVVRHTGWTVATGRYPLSDCDLVLLGRRSRTSFRFEQRFGEVIEGVLIGRFK